MAIITTTLTRLAQGLLQVTIVLIILKGLSTILSLGIWNILAMAVFVILYIIIGHLLGGPGLPERMTLGITIALRCGAVAMQGMPGAVPETLAFQVINLILVIAYISVFSKQLPQDEDKAEAVVTAEA